MSYTGSQELVQRVRTVRRRLKRKQRAKTVITHGFFVVILIFVLLLLPNAPKRLYVQALDPAVLMRALF